MKLNPGMLIALSLAAFLAYTHVSRPAQATTQELKISANFTASQSVPPDAQIELGLSRPLQPAEGKLAIFIGNTDMTSLFAIAGSSLSYSPKVLLLPAGDTEVTVYLVSPTYEWKEIARFPLRVVSKQMAAHAEAQSQPQPAASSLQPTPATAKKPGFAIIPALAINIKSQAAESHSPASTRPERPTFTDVTMQGGLSTGFERGAFGMQSQFNVAGSSFQKEALRFGLLGNQAPQIDLSNYLMQFKLGKAKLMAGNIAYGTNRYLINSFSSRGLSLSLPLTKRADFTFAALNGTSIVGWDNFFGLDQRQHQIVSGTLGFEFFPKRPGGLRLETSIMQGSLLPLSHYNQSNINDAEKSRGLGLRLIATDPSQRFRLDAGFTRSRYTNPHDPLLDQGRGVAPMREVTREAHYLDASYYLLRNFSITKTKKANLLVNFQHERVDPLFRSVAAYTQPNKLQNQIGVVGSVGDVTATFSHLRFNDNLDNIPSLLKSLTRRSTLIVGAPLRSIFGKPDRPSVWLPRLSYTFDRTHQFGAFIPTNADFKAPQVPDQIGTNQMLTAEWQGRRWRSGYRLNFSAQNNFGEKREGAKLKNLIQGFTFGLTPLKTLDVNVDVNLEHLTSQDTNANKDQRRLDHTWRFGFNANWRPTSRATLTALLSNTSANSFGDLSLTSNSRNMQVDLQWSWRFLGQSPAGQGPAEKNHLVKLQGQFFIRYAHRSAQSQNELFKLNSLTTGNTLNTGLSFTFF